jgi:thiopeptide-type bacteriocin biosynthesis protein
MHKTWLASYLFYNEPWEGFLKDAVFPFVNNILEEELAESYFFIRYWERGPHIRLRFYGDGHNMDNVVKPRIKEYFDDYFLKFASTRKDPEVMSSLPEDQQWFSNNSVQFIPYEPETERYGGDPAIRVAEEQFRLSSDTILSIIGESGAWNYERAMGAAIQLHLAFAHAVGMSREETKEFFRYIFTGWLPMAYETGLPLTEEKRIEMRQEVLHAFEENYKKQEASLKGFHATLWEAFSEDAEFEQEWLNKWLEGMRSVKTQLHSLNNTGKLIFPHRVVTYPNYSTEEEKASFWSIYSSYVHMTNNRLGVLNRDEGYLAYLIQKSL